MTPPLREARLRKIAIGTAVGALVLVAVITGAIVGTQQSNKNSNSSTAASAKAANTAGIVDGGSLVSPSPTAACSNPCGTNKACCSSTETCLIKGSSNLRRSLDTVTVDPLGQIQGTLAAVDGIGECVSTPEVATTAPSSGPAMTGSTTAPTTAVPKGGAFMTVTEPKTAAPTDPPRAPVPKGQVGIPAAAFGSAQAVWTNNLSVDKNTLDMMYIYQGSSAQWIFDVDRAGTFSVSYALSSKQDDASVTLGFVAGDDCSKMNGQSPGFLNVNGGLNSGGYVHYRTFPATPITLTAGAGQVGLCAIYSPSGVCTAAS